MKILLTLSLLLASIFTYAQKVKLTLNLEKDSTYYLTTNANMDIDQLINGVHQKVTTAITGKMAHKVLSVKDTVYEMELEYKSLGMRMQVGDKVMEFSTGGGKDDIASKLMSGMMNKPFLMTMSKSGRVLAIKNLDTLYTSMFSNLPPITDIQKAQFKARMQLSFGEKSIRGNIQDAFIIYPKIMVEKKDTWTTNTTIESNSVSVKTKMNYVLDDITNDSYMVNGSALIISDKAKLPDYMLSNGIMMRLVDMNGTATAKLRIDKKSGWIIQTKVTKMIKCSVQIKDTPKTPGGLTYPMTITAVLEGGSL